MEEKFTSSFKEILELEDQDLNLSDNFRDYDNWDSLANLSVIAMLDEEFGVHIDSKDFQNLQTVGDLMNEVKKRMA